MEKKKNDWKLNLLILGVAALMVLSCLAGYHLGSKKGQPQVLPTETTAPVHSEKDQQRLTLTAKVDYDTGIVSVPVAGREEMVHISNLYDVQITLPEGSLSLAEALSGGQVTPEEMIAWAKLDARAGWCKETCHSENGFAYFIYRYSNVELSVHEDVLEAPDGQQHLIRSLTVRDPGGQNTGFTLRIVGEDGLLLDLTKEDWGLSFAVTQADENGLTLTCTQSGGQLLGQPAIHSYMVSEFLYGGTDKIPVSWYAEDSSQWMMIRKDDTTVLRLEWENAIPSGAYALHVFVRDVYDPEDMHPLIRNFEDGQNHSVQFTVP